MFLCSFSSVMFLCSFSSQFKAFGLYVPLCSFVPLVPLCSFVPLVPSLKPSGYISFCSCAIAVLTWANFFHADGGIPPQQGQFVYRWHSSAMVVDIPGVLTGGPIFIAGIPRQILISPIIPPRRRIE